MPSGPCRGGAGIEWVCAGQRQTVAVGQGGLTVVWGPGEGGVADKAPHEVLREGLCVSDSRSE